MLNTTVGPSGKIGEVHVYMHADRDGTAWGRLESRSEKYRSLSINDVRKFVATDKKVKAVSKIADNHTCIHLHGCNLGRSPEALIAWRDMFGAVKGFGCAPDLFQHFMAGPMQGYAECPFTKVPILRKNLFGMGDVNNFMEEVIRDGPKICENLAPNFKEQFRKDFPTKLDNWLLKMFSRLRDAGEIPWDNVQKMKDEEAKKRMRSVFDQGRGIPLTFLSETIFDLEGMNTKEISEEKGGIFPWDQTAWKLHHHWEPLNPNS